MDFRSSSLNRYALMLGVLIAAGPLGIDMYLPAFPVISASLHTSVALVDLSLVGYFATLAFGQLVYGPLSDRYGRRPVLAVGLLIYCLAALGLRFAPNISLFIGLRVLQGFGGCSGTVIARSIVRDVATGQDAAQLFSRMLLVFGLAPILAPMLGSLVLLHGGWRAIFLYLSGYGLAALIMVWRFLPETHGPHLRSPHVHAAFRAYGKVLRDARFMCLAALAGAMQAAFFAYLAGSSFIFISLYGLTPLMYSVVFGLNSVALIGSSQITAPALRRLGGERVLVLCASAAVVVATLLVLSGIAHRDNAVSTAALLLALVTCQGIVAPTATVLALERYGATAGAAAAFLGMSLYGCGVVSSALVSGTFNGSVGPMFGTILLCALLAAACSLLLPKTR